MTPRRRSSLAAHGTERLEVCVEGDVQGVGFRYTALRIANALSVAGTAENKPDGSVRLVLEAPADVLRSYLLQLQTRFPDASFHISSPRPSSGLSFFDIR